MADIQANSASMAGVPPVTDEVFLADRKEFWSFFTTLVTGGLIFIVVLLILLAWFLV